MLLILNQIFYNNCKLSELTDFVQKTQIVQLLRKLAHLEEEIMKYPEGSISINEVGSTLSIEDLPEELVDKIRKSLSNQYVVVNKNLLKNRLVKQVSFKRKS